MKLIAGLGNPGSKYEYSRHNLGFLCVNRIARIYKIRMDKNQGKARTGTGTINGEQVVLARPQTYMNLSGQSIKLLMIKFKLKPQDVIVIFDDMDLPVGKIRVRSGGGSGGHNGIKSIITETGSPEFNRIRVGIGRPPAYRATEPIYEDDVIDYVLGEFLPEEKPIVEECIPIAAEAAVFLLTEGVTATMNKYNSTNLGKSEKE